ncbi:MAG: hypothetical protein U5K79_12685 [Cyclobacteriaceae bacterium]|nr:hypothetical protein [Cyclobacteriaceae bacterium]
MKSNISFSDTETAFSYKSDQELQKSYLLFLSINNPASFEKVGADIMKFALKVKLPVKGIIIEFGSLRNSVAVNQSTSVIVQSQNSLNIMLKPFLTLPLKVIQMRSTMIMPSVKF